MKVEFKEDRKQATYTLKPNPLKKNICKDIFQLEKPANRSPYAQRNGYHQGSSLNQCTNPTHFVVYGPREH